MADHVVEARADHQDQVRLAKCARARRQKAERVILGDHAAALRRGVEGDSRALDERLQLGFCLRPQHAAAGNDDRPLRRLEHGEQALDLRGRRLRPAAGLRVPGLRPFDLRRVDLLEQHVARQIEIHGARLARHRAHERLVQQVRQTLGVMRARRPFGAGLHHRQLVHVLERAAAPGADRRAAAERDDRHAVGPGVRDPGDQVGHGRPRGGHAHARAQAQARVGVRHHRRGLLVAHVDAAQPALQRLRLDHEHRRAHDEEEHVDALALERLGENLRTVHLPRLHWRRAPSLQAGAGGRDRAQIAPSSLRSASCSRVQPSQAPYTSSLCAPSSGAAWTLTWDLDILTGQPGMVNAPRTG